MKLYELDNSVCAKYDRICITKTHTLHDESARSIADITQLVIIVDKWHPLLEGVYGNLKH